MNTLKSLFFVGTICLFLALVGGMAKADVSVTINPAPSATFGINVAQTFSCTVAASGCEPTDKATKSYQWSVDGTAVPGATSSSYSFSSPAAGTHTISCSASIKDTTVDPVEDCGTSSGQSVAYIIGGPFTGDSDIHFYCDDSYYGDWGFLYAAGGQPSGTTYQWTITGNAKIVNNPLRPPSQATYAGIHPGSSNVGDVTASLTYSLNGVSVKSPDFPITVHTPTQFVVLKDAGTVGPTKYTSGDKAYGFDGQQLHFQIKDGLGQPITAYWNETWDTEGNGNGPNPPQIGDTLDSNGGSIDYFLYTGNDQPNKPSGDKEVGPFTHKYYVTARRTAGSGLGCLVQTYTGVTYYTYGVTGNGF